MIGLKQFANQRSTRWMFFLSAMLTLPQGEVSILWLTHIAAVIGLFMLVLCLSDNVL